MDEGTSRNQTSSLALVGPMHPQAAPPAGIESPTTPRSPNEDTHENVDGRVTPVSETRTVTPTLRFSKGKNRVVYSDDGGETEETMGEGSRRPPNSQAQGTQESRQVSFVALRPPSPHDFSPRKYATQDDILRICQSFHNLTRDIVQEVLTELRRMSSGRQGQGYYDADDEAEHATPRRQLLKPRAKHPGVMRRTAAENTLSVVSPLLALSIY